MNRTPSVVGKNKKKSQSPSHKVNKTKNTKTTKANAGDKNKSNINAAENEKPVDKLSNKVQGHTQIEHENQTTKQTNQSVDLGDRKFERSNSFFLTRKLSKIYDSLTSSKESVKDNGVSSDHDKKTPFKFVRSVSLAAISLKKDYRNSMRKPRLEQLSEEDHSFGVPEQKSKRKYDKKSSMASIDSLSSRTSEKSSIISSLKRTFSLTPLRRKATNPKWNASLMSLQQIDVMISYEDLSFIDYDKFNTYEENLMTKMKSSNQIDVNRLNADQFPGVKMRSRNSDSDSHRRHSTIIQPTNQLNEYAVDELDVNLKRWSNPCIGPDSNECVSSFSSYTPMKAQPIDGIDESDFRSNIKYFDGANISSTYKTYSNTDLGIKSNDCNDSEQQTQQSSFTRPQHTNNPFLDERSCVTETDKEPINTFQNDYRNGISSTDSEPNDVILIDYTTNKTHQSKNESSISTSSSSSLFVRNKNPFLIGEMKHSDDLTQSPMKICLVVSPPTSKLLQLKSKSLTHLDSFEPHNLMQSSVFPSNHTEVIQSNCFRVFFDVNTVTEKEELLPAVKGVTLRHVLSESLLRRNLSISQLAIFEPPGTSDIRAPLTQLNQVNEKTDTSTLAGKYLIITEQDEAKVYHPTLQKVASFQNDVQRPMRLYSSASAEEASETSHFFDVSKSTLTAVKPSKPRWSTLFGQKNPAQNQLCEILNSYAKNGVPQLKTFSSFEHSDYGTSLHYLNNIHGSWKEFVSVTNMKEHEIKIQSAIWELVTTEVDYIHALQTVTELFLSCLEAIQSHRILTDIDQNKLFSNIREIYEVNIKFWTYYLYPMVQNSIQMGVKMCIDYIKPGFEPFSTIFSPYKIYCAEHSTCQFYCKELNTSNTLFTSYLAWCESQKLCNRLRLADILVRPTQRLTKYGLLLGAIRKHVVDENDAESLDLMIHCVESFVFGVNTHLTMRQENERLKGIMARIESYDVVDTNNENLEKLLKQHSTMFDLCGPMRGCATSQERHLFMEGDLRYKDSTSKVDVHCFLLTDFLLICKPLAKKGIGNLKVIRQPFLTDRLKIAMKENTLYLIYLNEWDMATAAFTLQCSEARNWFDAFTKAKHIYSRLKQSSPFDSYNIRYHSTETLGIRKSPLNSSMGSRLSSLNNSHSGSVELNDSRNISMDYEKASSLSSDESMQMGASTAVQGSSVPITTKKLLQYTPSTKYRGTTPNTLLIQPFVHLGQSLPNLNLNASQTTNNMLLVPGTSSSGHSNLLSPSQRGISYPPPSPTRAILRRGLAFSASIKNPPLIKSRNIQSQASFTANVPVPLIGGTQPVISQQTIESTVQMKDTSKQQQQQQHHTSTTGPTKHIQVQQKLSNESVDFTGPCHSQQSKNEHIV